MKLPSIPFLKKEEEKEYFLALILRDEKVSAIVFEQIEGKINILGEREKHFGQSIENASDEELLSTLDNVISDAESSLPENAEAQKTVFGVKDDWIEMGKIKKPYLLRLKKASDALGLIPIGFLTISEAILHVLQEEEGAPITAIFAELGEKIATISLIRASKVVEIKSSPIEESKAKTVDTLLKTTSSFDVLPSRIILLNGESSTRISHEFISHPWSKSLPFLHIPQVTLLPKGFAAKAVIAGTAWEMGFEMLDDSTLKAQTVASLEKTEGKEQKSQTPTIDKKHEEEPSKKGEFTNDFGFLKEIDILLQGESVALESPLSKEPDVTVSQEESLPQSQFAKLQEEKASLFSLFLNTGKAILSFVSRVSLPKLPSLQMGRNKFIFIPPLILLFLIGVLLFYLFTLKATVTVYLNPKIVTQSSKATILKDGSSDIAKQVLKGEAAQIALEGSSDLPVTGKKEIGEKAKGSVTIYNSDLKRGHTFPKGTGLKAPNGLAFTIDNSITVASASGDASSITSSTAKTSITASDIGKEYNLPSGTKFSVGEESSTEIIAKNDNALSGGSKKEATVVSNDDLEKLEITLIQKLSPKAEQEISSQLKESNILIPNVYETNVTSKKFDKKAGDEADKISLFAKVTFQGISVSKKELDDFSSELITKNKPSDLVISEKGIETQIKDAKQQKNKNIEAQIVAKALFLTKLNNENVQNNIKGKSFEEAKGFLKTFPQFADAVIELSPSLPLLPKRLPQVGKNIKIEVKINE